jgi:hypothetical protein
MMSAGGSACGRAEKSRGANGPQSFNGLEEDKGCLPNKPRPELKPEPAAQQEPANLYLLYPVAPPPDAPPAWAPEGAAEQASQILANLVFIPEGNRNNLLFNKEIVPLLTELPQTWAPQEQPPEPELEQMLSEVMARMPQPGDLLETPRKLAVLGNFIAALRGNSCPPGNVNEEQNLAALSEAEFLPPGGVAAAAPPQSQADMEQYFGQEQPRAQEGGAAVPEGASFQIAPARLAFGASLQAAAAQPLSAENLFNAMVERISSLPEASPHLEISLKPDHLGKLAIDLRLGANGLSAKILASNESVRNLLAAHLDRLSDTLAGRGIRLENVEVIYSALSDKAFGRQPQEQEARQSAPRFSGPDSPPEALESAAAGESVYGPPLWADGPEWGKVSVEYLA